MMPDGREVKLLAQHFIIILPPDTFHLLIRQRVCIHLFGETLHAFIVFNHASAYGSIEYDALQRAAPAQSHIHLPVLKSSRHVYYGLVERQPLTFVYCHSPSRFQRILFEISVIHRVYCPALLVPFIARMRPFLFRHRKGFSVFPSFHHYEVIAYVGNLHYFSVVIQPRFGIVVFQEHHLRAFFQAEQFVSRIGRWGEIAGDLCRKSISVRFELHHFLTVHDVGLAVVCHEPYAVFRIIGDIMWDISGVQQCDIIIVHPAGTDIVEYGNEPLIFLTVYLFQLYGDKSCFLQFMAFKEIIPAIILSQYLPFIPCHDRRQLLQVAYEQQLQPSKRAAVFPQHLQYERHPVECVGPEHTHLVYDKQVESIYKTLFLF